MIPSLHIQTRAFAPRSRTLPKRCGRCSDVQHKLSSLRLWQKTKRGHALGEHEQQGQQENRPSADEGLEFGYSVGI